MRNTIVSFALATFTTFAAAQTSTPYSSPFGRASSPGTDAAGVGVMRAIDELAARVAQLEARSAPAQVAGKYRLVGLSIGLELGTMPVPGTPFRSFQAEAITTTLNGEITLRADGTLQVDEVGRNFLVKIVGAAADWSFDAFDVAERNVGRWSMSDNTLHVSGPSSADFYAAGPNLFIATMTQLREVTTPEPARTGTNGLVFLVRSN